MIALGARSQNNSYARRVLGPYAYASGAQRQVISVLSHLGLTASYPALVSKSRGSEVEGDVPTATGTAQGDQEQQAQGGEAEDGGSEEEYWREDGEGSNGAETDTTPVSSHTEAQSEVRLNIALCRDTNA